MRDARLNEEGNFKEKVKVDASEGIMKSKHLILTVKWNDKSEDVVLKGK